MGCRNTTFYALVTLYDLIFFNLKFFFYFTEQYAGCWFLVPQPGMEPVSPVVEVQSLNQWTTREIPDLNIKSTFKSTIVAPHLKWENKARIGIVNNCSQHASCMRFNLSMILCPWCYVRVCSLQGWERKELPGGSSEECPAHSLFPWSSHGPDDIIWGLPLGFPGGAVCGLGASRGWHIKVLSRSTASIH